MGLETGTYLNDLNTANPVGASDLLAQGDDHIRLVKTTLKNTFPNMGGTAWRVQNKGTNYTLAATDNMSVIRATAGITLATEAAATIGNGFIAIVVGDGGAVVIDPNGSETINGSATLTVLDNSAVVLYCNGTLFYALQLMIPNGVGLYLPAGQKIVFEGTTADAYEVTLEPGEPTSDITITLQELQNVVQSTVTKTLAVGYSATPYNAGTKSTGTFTPDEANGNFQYAVNGGAFTLAPPTNNCTIVIQMTNNGSAGAITTSGFSKVTGDTLSTTNADDIFLFITKCNGFSHLAVQALQ